MRQMNLEFTKWKFTKSPEERARELLDEQYGYCGRMRLELEDLTRIIAAYPDLRWFVYKGEEDVPWKRKGFKPRYREVMSWIEDSYIVNEEGWW